MARRLHLDFRARALERKALDDVRIERALNQEPYVVELLGLALEHIDEDAPVIPEPTTLAIWSVLGGLGFAVSRYRRRTK